MNRVLSAGEVADLLPEPTEADHKYTRGTVTLVTGSSTYPGAGVLSVGGALGAGAGFVRFAGSERAADLVLSWFPEVVLAPGGADALVIGCGWDESLRDPARQALAEHAGPVVLDAGALLDRGLRAEVGAPAVLTPHPGEARRLWEQVGGGGPLPTDLIEAARALSGATGSTVVLKSARTLVATPDRVWEYRARTAWPGVAGAGDVLAGVIGSVLARHWRAQTTANLGDVVAAAVWLHGEAGAHAAGLTSAGAPTHPIRASDIIRGLAPAWQSLPRG